MRARNDSVGTLGEFRCDGTRAHLWSVSGLSTFVHGGTCRRSVHDCTGPVHAPCLCLTIVLEYAHSLCIFIIVTAIVGERAGTFSVLSLVGTTSFVIGLLGSLLERRHDTATASWCSRPSSLSAKGFPNLSPADDKNTCIVNMNISSCVVCFIITLLSSRPRMPNV